MHRGAGVLVVAVLALSGCTAAPPPPVTTTVSASPVPAPTSAASASVASSAPMPSSTTPTASTPTTSVPTASTPTASAPGATRGCADHADVPAGGRVVTLGDGRVADVDGDGRPDSEFESDDPARYGIITAAGGAYPLASGLPGPGSHGGFSARLASPSIAVTVIDDGRQADLFAFVGCRFVRTRGVDGKPYVFGLNGFYDAGSGVACAGDANGAVLEGVLASRRSDGRYDVRVTRIDVSADGRTARNGSTTTRYRDLPRSDPRVIAANTSDCGLVPGVRTANR